MTRYEYKVVPAPDRGQKIKGVKRPEERFALTLAEVMNTLGAEGWDYIRADILPAQERSGLTSTQTVYHTLLVFRRLLPEATPMAEVETTSIPALAVTEALADSAPQDDQPPQDAAEPHRNTVDNATETQPLTAPVSNLNNKRQGMDFTE